MREPVFTGTVAQHRPFVAFAGKWVQVVHVRHDGLDGHDPRYALCFVHGGTQPLPRLAEIESKPAESSARPEDFANASPFRERRKEKDPARTAMFAAAALALLVFLGSMIAVLLMHVPTP